MSVITGARNILVIGATDSGDNKAGFSAYGQFVDLVAPADELRATTMELAAKIAAKSPLTLRVAKEAIRASQRMAVEEGILYERDLFCLCFSSADKDEGVAAFLEKRAAQWKGR